MKLDSQHVLILVIVLFVLYSIGCRCSCSRGNGFIIGGQNKNICKDIHPKWFGSKDKTTILKNKTDIYNCSNCWCDCGDDRIYNYDGDSELYVNNAVLSDGTNGSSLRSNLWRCNSNIINSKSNKILLDDQINLDTYRSYYCNTSLSGIFISVFVDPLNESKYYLDGSGSVIRVDYPYFYEFDEYSWGLIWDPVKLNNVIDCCYFQDADTTNPNYNNNYCKNDKSGKYDKCSCINSFDENIPCFPSKDKDCIKNTLEKDIEVFNDQFHINNECVFIRDLGKDDYKIKYLGKIMNKKPSGLFTFINSEYDKNYETFKFIKPYFDDNTNLFIIYLDIKTNPTRTEYMYFLDIIKLKDYEKYIKNFDINKYSPLIKYGCSQ